MQKEDSQPSIDTSNRYRWDRAGKRTLAAHVASEVFSEFKHLGEDQNKTTDAMIHEAVALLFQRHNRPVPPAVLKKLQKLGIPLPDPAQSIK
jgi:hypothetical protein